MAITRRQFIKRTGLATAGTMLGPGLFGNLFVRHALAFSGKYFIVLFLDGGNDGLNTVAPVNNGGGTLRTAYDNVRNTGSGGLNLSPGVLGPTTLTHVGFAADGRDPNTNCELALHPGFNDNPGGGIPSGGLKTIYDAGRVAVIQNCGYPDYSLSHEESRNIWETANPLGDSAYAGTGWMGRYLVNPDTDLVNAPPYGGADIPAVNISESVVGEYRNTGTSVLAVRNLSNFGFPYDRDYPEDSGDKELAFEALYGTAAGSGNATIKYIGNTGTSTETASQQYPNAHDVYHDDRASIESMYDNNDGDPALNTSTARGFREIAKIIYANENDLVSGVDASFFQLSNGGYDTHSNQGAGASNGQHYTLHAEVGNAIRLFWHDLSTMGAGGANIQNKVCILVWSEFSRRIQQNDNGTDHGSQGPMFIIGGTVNGGVYGRHPNLNDLDGEGNTKYSQNGANAFRSTDFRNVYGTVLKHWLGMDQTVITSSVLPVDGGDPNLYWTAPSVNFDMGFLP